MKKSILALIVSVSMLSGFPAIAAEILVCRVDNTQVKSDYSKTNRPEPKDRLFYSQEVEHQIERIKGMLTNQKLAWMFENCFPNTIDTTVHFRKDDDGKNDTFVYTGCI